MNQATASPETVSERQAIRLEAQTDTLEDFLETQSPPLQQDLDGRFVVVQDPTRPAQAPELLTVNAEGKPIHFLPDATSQSGWKQERIPMPGQAAAVSALRGFYRDGILYAFVHYAAAKRWTAKDADPQRGPISRVVPMIRDRAGRWSRLPLSNELANVLTRVRQLDVHLDGDGKIFLYGLSRHYSPEAFFLVTEDARGQWQVVHLEDATGFSAYRLVAGFGDEQLSVLRVAGPRLHYRGGSLRLQGGRTKLVYGSVPWQDVDLRHGDLALDQLIPFPKRHRGLDLLVLSSQQHLDHVTLRPDRTPTVLLLSGRSGAPQGGIAAISLSIDAESRYTLFALLQEDRRLWVLRQRSSPQQNSIDYHPWSEIGDRYGALAAPVSQARGPEFFAVVDSGRRVVHAHQPAESETDVWQRTLVEAPRSGGQGQRCTTHNLELTALDEQGQPTDGAVIHVSADRVATVYVNGLSYRVGPKPLAPVALETNSAGRLSLRVPCRRQTGGGEGESLGLSAPVITARLAPRGKPVFERAYAPDLTLYKRLADLDPEHPMTADRLKAKGFLPPNFDPGQAELVAVSTRQVARNMLLRFAHQEPGLAQLAAAPFTEGAWEFDFQGGGVRVRTVKAEPWERLAAQAPKGLGRALGDLLRWIANTARAIAKVVLRVTAKVVELVIETARGIQRFVLDAAAQTAEFLTGLFKSLAELTRKVRDAAAALIQMFEALLDFGDIVITKDVLKAGFTSFVTSLENSLREGVPEYLTAKFQGARKELAQGFARARTLLDGKTLEQIARQNGGGHTPGNDRYSQAISAQGVRGGFVGQHTLNALEGSKTLRIPKLSAREQKALDEVLKALEAIYRDHGLATRAESLRDDLRDVFEKPENLLQGSLKLLLNLLHGALDLALTVANALINLILKLLGTALGLLSRLFEQTLPIPVVGALYKKATDSDLSVLDLSLLLVAAPGTILYKVITKLLHPSQPIRRPFERSQIASIRTLFSQFGDLRQMIEGPARAAKVSARERKATKELLLVFGLVGGCTTFFYNYFEIGTDALAAAQVAVTDLGAIACIVGLVMIFLATPISSLQKRFQDRSTAEHYGLVIWIARFAPLGLNAVIASATKGAKVLKGIPVAGPILTCLIGVIAAAAAAVAVGLQIAERNVAGVLNALRAVCAGTSDMARLFIPLLKAKPPWNFIAALILVGVVRLSGLAQSGLGIAAAIAAFAAPAEGLAS